MPELPEVETIVRGIQPHLEGQRVKNIIIRRRKLRWPIPLEIDKKMLGETILRVSRRAKYLLISTIKGTALLHLGMSGRLNLLSQPLPPKKHDHFDIELSNKMIMRFTDPRRFGAFLWTDCSLNSHPLLKNLGPEPLDKNFSAKYLWACIQKRSAPIKSLLMNNKVVVGVGNIYATEALFVAKIHPQTPAKKLSLAHCQRLVKAIKTILRQAIRQGGTTLKDFVDSKGNPGYFSHFLKVYGREGLPCPVCHTIIQTLKIGQRSSAYCKQCQI